MFMDVMQDSLLEYIGVDPAYFIIGLLALIIILFIMLFVQMGRISSLKKRMRAFMSGKSTESLEEELKIRFRELDALKQTSLNHTRGLNEIGDFIKLTYSKIGIVKYDAFQEMGGKMSFVLCILNDKNDGMLMNSVHSREGCYTYIKEIVDGNSIIVLSEEEQEALERAMETKKSE